jgi:hypothetical protein
VSEPKTHLEHLRDIAEGLEQRMASCDADQNYATLARERRVTLAEIAVLEKGLPQPKGTALDELTKRRAAKGATPGPSRAARP